MKGRNGRSKLLQADEASTGGKGTAKKCRSRGQVRRGKRHASSVGEKAPGNGDRM